VTDIRHKRARSAAACNTPQAGPPTRAPPQLPISPGGVGGADGPRQAGERPAGWPAGGPWQARARRAPKQAQAGAVQRVAGRARERERHRGRHDAQRRERAVKLGAVVADQLRGDAGRGDAVRAHRVLQALRTGVRAVRRRGAADAHAARAASLLQGRSCGHAQGAACRCGSRQGAGPPRACRAPSWLRTRGGSSASARASSARRAPARAANGRRPSGPGAPSASSPRAMPRSAAPSAGMLAAPPAASASPACRAARPRHLHVWHHTAAQVLQHVTCWARPR